MSIEVEMLSLGDWPDRDCGLCGKEDSEHMGIARHDGVFGALGICAECMKHVKMIFSHDPKGDPN